MPRTAGTLTVSTAGGWVHGYADDRVRRWLGIPYAAAPVGPLRFRPPAPHPGWSGVREVTTPGAISPQHFPVPRSTGGARDEDCLVLNITAPPTAGDDRPVLVWIHGGAFLHGCGSQYDPSSLVTVGDLIVVTINYRLGPLGFVDFGSVVGERVATNLGLRDQIAALRWVHDNIRTFGGDPTRITIAGESAGAIATSALLTVPEIGPLISGAILQSGTYSLLHSRGLAAEVAHRYAERLGLSAGDGDQLERIPVASLLSAQRAVAKDLRATLSATPWFDGDLLPSSLAHAVRTPLCGVPLLAGTNRNESTFFARTPGDILPTERTELNRLVNAQVSPERARTILNAYPCTHRGTADLSTDLLFQMPMTRLAQRHAEHHPTWLYRLDARNALLGATHGLDLVYLFDYPPWYQFLWRGRATPDRRALTTQMRTGWAKFVNDGHPGPGWPRYDRTTRTTFVLDRHSRVMSDPTGPRLAAWDDVDIAPALQAAQPI